MIFNSFQFVWLFPIIFCVYWALSSRRKLAESYPRMGNALLIILSYGIYMQWKPVYALILLGITAWTYLFAIQLEHRHRKWYGVFAAVVALVPLLLFKYYNFVNDSLIQFFSLFGISVGLPGLNWALPLGLSFYTLQALGYLLDVYHRRIPAERDWWDYMLFVCFFPQIVCGPISKAKDLLPQIKARREFRYAQAVQGLKWLLWGIFLKVVVADRLGETVDYIFGNYTSQSGPFCALGAFLYAFQIYGDFAGYSFCAVGVGELLGFELINNFRRPYLSQSVTEFWHRWHISLSTWLKDYVYIPLGGSRCSRARNYWNILVTFLVSGVWHGANWTFIVWGLLHGVFQIAEKFLGLNKLKSSGVLRVLRVVGTFVLVDVAWIFFRMPTLADAWNFVVKILTDLRFSVDVALPEVFWCLCLIVMVLGKDVADESPRLHSLRLLHSGHVVVRWSTYVILLFLILFTGVLASGKFIYAGF